MFKKLNRKFLLILITSIMILDNPLQPASALPPFPQTGRIYIAATNDDENSPAVAYCPYNSDTSGLFLSVFINNGVVFGQYINDDGTLQNPIFQISNGGFPANYIDIACIEIAMDLFIVTWSGEDPADPTNSDVYAKVLHPSVSIQNQIIVSATGLYEYDPAIACNSEDSNCLIVYSVSGVGSGDIQSWRITVTVDGIALLGDMFQPTSGSGTQLMPDVAWNDLNGSFMIVWQEDSLFMGNPISIRFSVAYDAEQGAGSNELIYSFAWLITPVNHDYDRTNPVIAYNSYDNSYLVAYVYDFYGDLSDLDIYARRVNGVGSSTIGSPFWVMQTTQHEQQPSISFSGGAIFSDESSNQFLIAARRGTSTGNSGEIFVQVVKGPADASGDDLEGTGLSLDLNTGGNDALLPVVIGSSRQDRYLVAWNHYLSIDDMDVYGYLLAPYGAYIPMIIK